MKIRIKLTLFVLLVLIAKISIGQNYSGRIINKDNDQLIKFVNIGVLHENIGTVSDINGNYNLELDQQFDNDSLMFSCIGYERYSIRVLDFKKLKSKNIYLKETMYELNEVIVKPKFFKRKTLGVKTTSKFAQGGFGENKLGYELGILMKNKKTAFLENLNINIANCTFDSIFYRVNVYIVKDKLKFENILKTPIYIELSKNEVKNKVVIDLKPYGITVQGDFLVTLEHVKDLGEGSLNFCSKLPGKTIYRKSSQGLWEKAPIGISISINAKVEK